MRTYKVHMNKEVFEMNKEVFEIEADKLEFYQLPESINAYIVLSVEGQVVATFRNWDYVL